MEPPSPCWPTSTCRMGDAAGLVDLEFVFTGFNTGMEYATGSWQV